MTYRIVTEHHVMPAAHYNGKPVPPIEFFYAIRRADDSLVFRAETLPFADEILSRLIHFTAVAR